MVRKLDLIIIMFISMFLMPLPLYAHGGGHGGGGGGHGGFGGHGFGRHGGFGHGGFHTGHFGHGDFGHFDHGHFHHHHHGHFEEEEEEENFLFASGLFFGFGFGALFPLATYPYYYPPYYDYPYTAYSYADQLYGNLEIQVAPEDVEIYVDGRFIGKANHFRGSAVVLVSSGTHVVEFRYKGASTSTNVRVDPDSKSVVQQHFSISNSPKNPV